MTKTLNVPTVSEADLTAQPVPVDVTIFVLRIDGKPATKRFLAQVPYAVILDSEAMIVGTPLCRLPGTVWDDGMDEPGALTVLCSLPGGSLVYSRLSALGRAVFHRSVSDGAKRRYAASYNTLAALPFAFVEV